MTQGAPVLYGKYQLLDPIARGGMAEVFRAKSHGVEGFEKVLVIKRILGELSSNPQFTEMFINEAKIAVSLSHANIVQVFDLGKADETYFIAMEYVSGFDLATVLARSRSTGLGLPLELALFVSSELAKALDYAHRRRDAQQRPLNIVHRDVSPQNVLISFEGEVKLTDFGIAKAALAVSDQDELESAGVKGKYAYMAPEQARGEAVDARADIFALGVVLYELIAGRNPFFVPESAYETLRRVRECSYAPIASLAPGLAPELESIVARAMSSNPADRHPNAGALYEELVHVLYSIGRRVGGHELAQFLSQLRQADDRRRSDTGMDGPSLLSTGTSPAEESYLPEATPVEVPIALTERRTNRRSGSWTTRPAHERRDVTMLVARAGPEGSLNPSLVERLMRRYDACRLASLGGDDGSDASVMLFGARDPDGRDTEAAARFALRLVAAGPDDDRAPSPSQGVSVGLSCGRVLVDLDGEPVLDSAVEALARSARRLADDAGLGLVLACASAQRALADSFTVERADGPEERYWVRAERSLADSGRFVGRRSELRRIGELLSEGSRGLVRVIGLKGEAGVGKTRLIHEARRRLKLGGHDVALYLATCPRDGRAAPLGAISEMFRAVLGIDELEDEREAREKVARLRELGLGLQEVAAVATLLGVGSERDGGANAAEQLRSALSRTALKLANDRLTVLAWDGAERIDAESLGMLEALSEDSRGARVVLVVAHRPDSPNIHATSAGWVELALGPMSDEDVAHLTGTRLAADEVPLDLLREVTAKSGGNPLYVEEYLKALVDAGAVSTRADGRVVYDSEVAEVQVPRTLRGIVSSRLARLRPRDRHLLQVAATVADRFSTPLLAHVAGDSVTSVARALEQLEDRGLVVRVGADFRLAHEVVGEVLRDSLTLGSRRELHGAIANALEELHPERRDELAEVLAHHRREAGDRAAAVDHLMRAAKRLVSEHAIRSAFSVLERALELMSQLAQPDREQMLELYRRIGELSFRSRQLERGAEHMSVAVALCEGLERESDVALFSMLRGRLLVNLPASSEEGRRWLDRAGAMARQLGDRRLLRDVTLATAEADMRLGEHRSATRGFEEALSISREMRDTEAQVRCLIPLALASASDGRLDRGLGALEEARRLGGPERDPFTECEQLKIEALVHYFAGDYDATLRVASAALELAKEHGFEYEAAVNAHNLGEAYLRRGDYKRAFASLRYSFELSRERGWENLQWANMRVLGFIDATRFGSKEGREHVLRAARFAESRGLVWHLLQSRYFLALIDQQRGNEDAARAALREILRLAGDHGHSDYVKAAQRGLKALDAGESIQLMG
jgi:serine/threonine protein kinase/tetratricopeptide (TPR) repeat protein